jgi:transcriptional regulator with XRE-family HTH domain
MRKGTACSISREDFVKWLDARRSAGESLSAIGRSLGVSQPAISQWLAGTSGVSGTALLLAARLIRDRAVDWPLGGA